MKVVLTTDIGGIGKRGEEKEVNDGFWRNFLAPKGLAVLPEDPKAMRIATQLADKEKNRQTEIDRLKQLAIDLAGQRISLSAKTSGKRLFKAITGVEIAEALGIDRKLVTTRPVKSIGEHEVVVRLPHGFQATVTVVVEPD